MKRVLPVLAAAALLAGCFTDNLARVAEVDGSNDHRIFRIGSVTKLMMEPVLWQLEDSGQINLDRPVTDYFRDDLPPEFQKITLRMLHDNKSGLPREFIDPWCLGDVYQAFKCGCVGSNLYAGFDTRREFVERLWDPRIRGEVKRHVPRYSNMGYVLMMMAILDHVRETPDALVERYLVKPYGLEDTSFLQLPPAHVNRLTPCCAGHLPWWRLAGQVVPEHREGEVTMLAGGMRSSPSDVLKVCYVLLPHLDRMKGLLEKHRLSNGHTVYYRTGMIYGGHTFVGFEPREKRTVALFTNTTCWDTDDGFDLFESLLPTRDRSWF